MQLNLKSRFCRLIIVFLFFSLFFTMSLNAHSPVRAQNEVSLSKAEMQVKTQLSQAGSAFVMVELNMAYQPGLDEQDAAKGLAQQKVIRDQQAALTAALKETKVQNMHNFQFIPFMSMQIDQAAFDVLIGSELVKRVYEDERSWTSLDDSIPLINADDVWAEGYSGAGQVVAILDTGVEKTHSMLSGKVVSEACYSTNGAFGDFSLESLCPGGVSESTAPNSAMPYAGVCPAGKCDHGTHVAAIAAGTSGVAKDAEIIAVQVFSLMNGSSTVVFDSDLVKGLERVYALRSSYSIAAVNLSLGSDDTYDSNCDSANQAEKLIIESLRSAGIATIAASGNDSDSSGIASPACISSAISVGASTDDDQVAWFSNSAEILDLLAPGYGIVSAIPDDLTASKNGTSMATPHVAGAWAVMRSSNTSLDIDTILDLFKHNGVAVLDTRNNITKPRIDLWPTLFAQDGFYIKSPADFNVRAYSDTQINLSWEEGSPNTDGYKIERSEDGASWTQIGTAAADKNSYADSGLSPQTSFWYRVRAYNTDTDSTYTAAKLDTSFALPTPQDLKAVLADETNADLSWLDPSGDEEGFHIERRVNGGSWERIHSTVANVSSYRDAALERGQTYDYRVQCFSASGVSNYSNLETVQTITHIYLPMLSK